jgi:hybrid cluster-associated redox disulfide protein
VDKYTRAFIVASLIYLLAGGALGLLIGTTDTFASFYFTHVHFNLLGFMAMMIYGVGYFILPRFNAKAIKWPGLIPWHFYLANVGLIGMCIFKQLSYDHDASYLINAFAFFGLVEFVSIAMFVLNLIATLASASVVPAGASAPRGMPLGATDPSSPSAPRPQRVQQQAGRGEAFSISASTRVGEIITRYPDAREILADAGIKALANEAHAEQVKKMPVTLGTACMKHGIDLEAVIEKLKSRIAGEVPAEPAAPRRSGDITADMTIGDVLSRYPDTKEVFQEYFGSGCFDCPGQTMESIAQGALMHNVDAGELLEALNAKLSG